ncbi:hypothetical protein [Streptomyces sp. NPDC002403]
MSGWAEIPLPVCHLRGQQRDLRLFQRGDRPLAGGAIGLLGLEQRKLLVPVAAPADVLRLVAGPRPQEAVLRAGNVLDFGELGDLFQVHAPGRCAAQGGVVELLRAAEPLAGAALEPQGSGGCLLLDLVHPDQGEFGGLQGVLGRHALALVVLDQGQEPCPCVPADEVSADERFDLPPFVPFGPGGGVGDLRGLGAPPALECAVGAVRQGADADRVLDTDGLDRVDQVGVGFGVVLAGVAVVADDAFRVDQDGGRGLLVGADGGGPGCRGHVWPPCAC